MSTTTATLTVVHLCQNCQEPSTEVQGLVYEVGGYVHAACSTRNYELVTVISFPSDDLDPEPEPTNPAPALALVTGPDLCDDCKGLHDSFDLCDDCQNAWNEWDSDHAPDYDVLYERYLAAWELGLVAA